MQNIASLIDHTFLRADARLEDIQRVCLEARTHSFHSVCVNPCYVPAALQSLEGSGVAVCTVLGFPLGASHRTVKAFEAHRALIDGAVELDMVLNIGFLKSGRVNEVLDDIRAVTQAAAEKAAENPIIKVILETCLLTDDEIRVACEACMEAGAHFVKTSTGFGAGGATIEAVRLMRSVVGDRLGVKASGGIRDYETAVAMVRAGASRLGTSASVAIVQGRTQVSQGSY